MMNVWLKHCSTICGGEFCLSKSNEKSSLEYFDGNLKLQQYVLFVKKKKKEKNLYGKEANNFSLTA